MENNKPTNLFEYYQSQGKTLPAFGSAERTNLANQAGITGYTGTSEQNQKILETLQNTQANTPQTPQNTPQVANNGSQGQIQTNPANTQQPQPQIIPQTPQDFNNFLNDNFKQEQNLLNTFQDFTRSLTQNGAPLNQREQQIVNNLNVNNQNTVSLLNQANQSRNSYFEALAGRGQINPNELSARIQTNTQETALKINDINTTLNNTLLDLYEAVDNNAFKKAKDLYDDTLKMYNERQKEITSFYEKQQETEKELRDYNFKLKQFEYTQQQDIQKIALETRKIAQQDFLNNLKLKEFNLSQQEKIGATGGISSTFQTPNGEIVKGLPNNILENIGKLKLNEGQSNAVAFASRAIESQKNLKKLIGEPRRDGKGSTLIGFGSETTGYDPVSGVFRFDKLFNTNKNREYERNIEDFTRAILRKESGATISPEELEAARGIYSANKTGQDLSDLQATEQKRDNVIKSLIAQSGAAAPYLLQYYEKSKIPDSEIQADNIFNSYKEIEPTINSSTKEKSLNMSVDYFFSKKK